MSWNLFRRGMGNNPEENVARSQEARIASEAAQNAREALLNADNGEEDSSRVVEKTLEKDGGHKVIRRRRVEEGDMPKKEDPIN